MKEPRFAYIPDFVPDHAQLFDDLCATVEWDERMRARKTASFGIPYNYSGMTYPECEIPSQFQPVIARLHQEFNMQANNCLANYYFDGGCTMGFHSDTTNTLRVGTGIAIVSLGATRDLTFRRKDDKTQFYEHSLESGSLLFMPLNLQAEWQHALLSQEGVGVRISLTFREVVTSEIGG